MLVGERLGCNESQPGHGLSTIVGYYKHLNHGATRYTQAYYVSLS